MTTEPIYPEHEKLSACLGHSQAQGEFIEWLESKGIFLGEWVTFEGNTSPSFVRRCGRVSKLLAEFHNINEDVLEAEKRVMLRTWQKQTETK